VLDAALSIVVAQGTAAVTMTSVAEHLGVTKPVVYACFAAREDVLLALLEREEQALLAGVLAALPENPRFDDPERLLVDGFRALFKVVADRPASWRIVFAAGADPAIAERFAQGRAVVTRQVAELMAPALRQWDMPDAERKLPVLVETFVGAAEGAVRAMLQAGDTWTADELGEFVGTTLFRALRGTS